MGRSYPDSQAGFKSLLKMHLHNKYDLAEIQFKQFGRNIILKR